MLVDVVCQMSESVSTSSLLFQSSHMSESVSTSSLLFQSSTDGQQPMTRAIVATRMLELTNNGVLEFKEVPSLADVSQP